MKPNKEKIIALYDAFGQGNIPFILENVADNFTWTDQCDPAIAPQGGTYHGKEGFLQFFHNLGGSTDTTHWQVDKYVAENDTVVAFGKHGVTIKSTGKSILLDWVMIWNFANGHPVSGGSFIDTARYQKMFE
jgi:uncharacterized protein